MEVAGRPAGCEHALDQGPGTRAVAAAEIAFGKPDRTYRMSPAHVGTLEPGKAFTQLRDTLIEPASFDFPITEDHPGPRGVARQRCERQRFIAAFQASLNVALLNMGQAQPGPADYLQPQVLEGNAVLDPAPAVIDACRPIAEVVRDGGQMPKRPARPPTVAARVEESEGALPRLQSFLQSAGDHVDLGQAGFGNCVDLVQAKSRRNPRRLSTMFDCDIWPAS